MIQILTFIFCIVLALPVLCLCIVAMVYAAYLWVMVYYFIKSLFTNDFNNHP